MKGATGKGGRLEQEEAEKECGVGEEKMKEGE